MLKRTTIYLDPKIHQALRIKAMHNATTMSEIINEAIRYSLREDAIDLKAIKDRAAEPDVPYEVVLKNLKKNGLI